MNFLDELRALGSRKAVQLTALGGLFGLFLFFSLSTRGYLLDPDIWWHLKVGDWIVEHKAVPWTGILSRTAATKPWVAYSWGFEVILSRVYAWFGLVGFAYYGILLGQMVSASLFGVCYAISGRFWRSWLLTLLGTMAFAYSLFPRPVFFSMSLFAAMLYMMLQAKRTGRIGILYWLPLMFWVWANMHIQFIYGLATLGLMITVEIALHLAARLGWPLARVEAPSLPVGKLMGILAACFAVACVGPYGYYLFVVVAKYSKATQTYFVIQELQAPSFTSYTYFIFLFVILAAFYLEGKRERVDVFRLALLTVATVLSFRTVRDAWFPVIPAALFLADTPRHEGEADERIGLPAFAGFAAIMVLFAVLLGSNMGFTLRGIDYTISREYPVDAANFVRRLNPPGPLYNDFNFGGFLTWYMPDYPVVVDGRNDLYGDEFVAKHIYFNGGDKTDGDPLLDESNLLLLSADSSLAKLLKQDPRFRLVFEDRLANVYLRN
jgi:hypothetical protein